MKLKRTHLDELSFIIRNLATSIEDVDGADSPGELAAAEKRNHVHFGDLQAWATEMRTEKQISKMTKKAVAAQEAGAL